MHDELVEKAKQAINLVFGDCSVDQAQTIKSLNELIEEIEVMLDALQ
jgi:hypothetical protein